MRIRIRVFCRGARPVKFAVKVLSTKWTEDLAYPAFYATVYVIFFIIKWYHEIGVFVFLNPQVRS